MHLEELKKDVFSTSDKLDTGKIVAKDMPTHEAL